MAYEQGTSEQVKKWTRNSKQGTGEPETGTGKEIGKQGNREQGNRGRKHKWKKEMEQEKRMKGEDKEDEKRRKQ